MKYGLIGERLGHSFSKKIHERLGYEYELREIEPKDIDAFMKERDFLGINVTMPYKATVIPYLDWIDDRARAIGAVNTIVNRDGRLYGYNTDFNGMIALINRAGIDIKGKKVAILGTGGTSKTAEAVLNYLGAGQIIKVSRSEKDKAISYEELYASCSDTEIIINTTPVGMYPNIWDCPIDITKFDNLSGVVDAVYNPINTTLVQSARAIGIKAEGGLYMLTAQAVEASQIFFDKHYPNEMQENIYREIKGEKENTVLIGMPSSGKSTIGRIVADKLGKKFVDTDELIEEKTGMKIRDFFTKHGEAEFRRIESRVINSLSSESGIVIATGGGAVLNESNVRSLKYNGKVYFIDRPLSDLMPTSDRPLSKDIASLKKLYKERYSIYCNSCDEIIKADGDAETVAKKILEFYK